MLYGLVLVSPTLFKRLSLAQINSQEIEEAEIKLEKCFICLENLTNTIIFPCLHTGMCAVCGFFNHIKKKGCPICRRNILKLALFEIKEKNRPEFLEFTKLDKTA